MRLSLSRRLSIYLILVTLVPLLAVSLIGYRLAGRAAAQSQADQFRSTAALTAALVDHTLRGLSGVLAVLPPDLSPTQIRQILVAEAPDLAPPLSVDILSPDGIIRSTDRAIGASNIRMEALPALYTAAAARPDRTWIGLAGDVRRPAYADTVLLLVRIGRPPQRNPTPNRNVSAPLILVRYPATALHPLLANLTLPSDISVAVIDADGRLVFHPQAEQIGARLTLDPIAAADLAVAPWQMVAFSVGATRTTFLNQVRSTMLALAGLTMLAVAILIFWITRQAVSPLYALAALFRRLEAGAPPASLRLPPRPTDPELATLYDWFRAHLDLCREKENLEAEIARLRTEAQAADRAKGLFLANMTHEIRTPMNGIVGMVELLQQTDLDPQQQEYLEAISLSAENLLTLLNDIIDLAQLESGELHLEQEPFSLRELIHEAMHPLAMTLGDRPVELIYYVEPEVPDNLLGDPGRVRQILAQLLSNGIKFTPAGEVLLRVRALRQNAEDALLEFQIRDTGVGIPADKQAQIFEIFTQADMELTRRFSGTGIGLAMVARLVELMGGRIRVESQEGQGSTFYVTLPVRRWQQASGDLPQPPSLVGQRILVVDDNRTHGQLLSRRLMDWGAHVQTYTDGRSAILAVRRARETGTGYHWIFLDMDMPEMDGIAAANWLVQEGCPPETIVAMLRPTTAHQCLPQIMQMGIRHMLFKPFGQAHVQVLFQEETRASLRGSSASLGPEAPSPASAAIGATRSLRILLVEDNPLNQHLTSLLLERAGHRVTIAHNGREAVELWRAGHYDLILMDIQMPEMDGFEATVRIRSLEQERGEYVPIIALTAHALRGDRERCMAAGMDGYLSKPVRAGKLLEILEMVARGAFRPTQAAEKKLFWG